MIYTILYTKKAIEDIQNLKAVKLADKAENLCKFLTINSTPLNSKKLYRNLVGKRSIRINLQHRLVYEILEDQKNYKNT
ncbi:toxin of toxin-antitoxin system [Candidatus Rickettsia kedanie]|uniref:Toxin YoeB n=1 Tax=Candidatus Rickettsia kedanie TaxID=3115352 RepID=A0ABP9TSW2_9RICK